MKIIKSTNIVTEVSYNNRIYRRSFEAGFILWMEIQNNGFITIYQEDISILEEKLNRILND